MQSPGWWYTYPSMTFPIYGKIKFLFQSPPTRTWFLDGLSSSATLRWESSLLRSAIRSLLEILNLYQLRYLAVIEALRSGRKPRKAIEKPWENDGFVEFYGRYPLVMSSTLLLKPWPSRNSELVPWKMLSFHSFFVCLPSGNQTWRAGKWTIEKLVISRARNLHLHEMFQPCLMKPEGISHQISHKTSYYQWFSSYCPIYSYMFLIFSYIFP